jgi:heme exporter protein D
MNGAEFSWSEFFNMGGYAFYVWTSYGLTFAVLVLNIVLPLMQRKQTISRVRRAIRREAMKSSSTQEPMQS